MTSLARGLLRPMTDNGGVTMRHRHLMPFLSFGAMGTALIIGAGVGAIAQTAAPPAPAAPVAPAAPAAAPQFPPTATIAAGYPGVGPGDPSLRTLSLPGGKKVHVLPATLETTQ